MREVNDKVYPIVEMVELDGVPHVKTTIDASTIIYRKMENPEKNIIRKGRNAKQPSDKSESSDGRDGLSDA